MKKNLSWLFWLLILIFVYVLVSRATEIEALVNTLMQGKWIWVLIAAILQYLYMAAYAGVYHSAFSVVDVRSRWRDLIPVMFGAMFMNVTTPLIAGGGGSLLFVDDARRRGESVPRATTGTILVYLSFLVSFQAIMVPGMIMLALRGQMHLYQSITAAIMYVYIITLSVLISLAFRRPEWLARILGWTRTAINWAFSLFKRKNPISEEWVRKTTEEITTAAMAIASKPGWVVRTFAVALIAHLANMFSLWAVCLAFNLPLNIGGIMALYFIMLLFTVVSVTPQGVGIVEGAMVLVLGNLGIPSEQSTVVTLAYRGLSFWLPLLVGFILLRQLRMFNPKARPYSDATAIYMVSFLTFLMGLANVFSALSLSFPEQLAWFLRFLPLGVERGGRLTAALAGFGLLVLTYGLLRRKRVAWLATIILLYLSAISHLLVKLDYNLAIGAILLAAWLLYLNPHFHARSDPPSIRNGLLTLVVAVGFTLCYGVAGFYLLHLQSGGDFSLRSAFMQTLSMLVEFYNPGLVPLSGLGRYFALSIYVIGISTFGYAIIMLLRPVLVRHSSAPAELRKAKEIIRVHGKDSLAPFTLLVDKLYFFSRDGCVVSYRMEGRIALALGDPIGPNDRIPAAIREFVTFCGKNDWVPVFYSVSKRSLAMYEAEEFRHVRIGDEGVLDLSEYGTGGGKHRNIQSALAGMKKGGFHYEVIAPPLPHRTIESLRTINDSWLTQMRATEMRFSMGWFYDEYVRSNPVLVISDRHDYRVGFTNILSVADSRELILDLVRYRSDIHPRVGVFLLASLVDWAGKAGFQRLNLGLSTLSGMGKDHMDSLAERALHYMYEHVEVYDQSKGLSRFKAKFDPAWEPRFMVMPDIGRLPAAIIALIRADSGDDMLSSLIRF